MDVRWGRKGDEEGEEQHDGHLLFLKHSTTTPFTSSQSRRFEEGKGRIGRFK